MLPKLVDILDTRKDDRFIVLYVIVESVCTFNESCRTEMVDVIILESFRVKEIHVDAIEEVKDIEFPWIDETIKDDVLNEFAIELVPDTEDNDNRLVWIVEPFNKFTPNELTVILDPSTVDIPMELVTML